MNNLQDFHITSNLENNFIISTTLLFDYDKREWFYSFAKWDMKNEPKQIESIRFFNQLEALKNHLKQATLIIVLGIILFSNPVQAFPILKGNVQYEQDIPQIELFKQRLLNDDEIPHCCNHRQWIERLLRVSSNPSLRKIVWSRIIRQDLFWESNETIRYIEKVAEDCRVPLK